MRGVVNISGSKDVKSSHSVGLRSIPKIQRSSYLELYRLKREKDSLERELVALQKRRGSAERQLCFINSRMEILQKETQEEQKTGTRKRLVVKPHNTVFLTY